MLWPFLLLGAMSGTRHKYCTEPAPIQYAPRLDPRLLRALWAQWRTQGPVERYGEVQEKLREIVRRRVRPLGPDEKG
jgi:hypothetical protein